MSDEHGIGRCRWVIPEGYIPPDSQGAGPELTSHEAFWFLNAGVSGGLLRITFFFEDR
jgi:hypothetical protein